MKPQENQPNKFGPLSSRDTVDRFGPIHNREKLFPQRPIEVGAGLKKRGYGGAYILEAEEVTAVEQVAVTEADHPFKCPERASGAITPSAGSVNGNLVTGTPSVSGSGVQVVYVKVTMTLNVTDYDYVLDTFFTETAWAYGVASSLPADTTTAFYILCASYEDGALTLQNLERNMFVRPRDDGTGTTTPDAIWW